MADLKILIGCATYNGQKHCLDAFLKGIRAIEGDYDFLFADNSATDEYAKHLKEQSGFIVHRIPRKETALQSVIASRNHILNYAMENGYDYVLNMDQDVIVPRNILTRLLSAEKDIISGLYYGVFRRKGGMKKLPTAYIAISDEEFEEIKQQGLPPGVTSPMDIRRHMTMEEARSNNVLEVIIPSNGCMLISKEVLKRGIRYGTVPGIDESRQGDEIRFCLEAKKQGFRLFVDTSVKCKHAIFVRD